MPAYTLVIGNKNYSSWSLRASLLAHHCKLHVEELRLPLDTEDFPQRIAAFSPAGRVPVLICDGLPVWDTLAIAEYLAERHPEVWPSDPHARSYARCVSAEMHAGFSALRRNMPMNCRATGRQVTRTPALDSDIARVEAIWSEGRARFADQGPWLCGSFSAADCMYAPVASRFQTYGVELSGSGAEYSARLLDHPHVLDWVRAAHAEAEYLEHEELGRAPNTGR